MKIDENREGTHWDVLESPGTPWDRASGSPWEPWLVGAREQPATRATDRQQPKQLEIRNRSPKRGAEFHFPQICTTLKRNVFFCTNGLPVSRTGQGFPSYLAGVVGSNMGPSGFKNNTSKILQKPYKIQCSGALRVQYRAKSAAKTQVFWKWKILQKQCKMQCFGVTNPTRKISQK